MALGLGYTVFAVFTVLVALSELGELAGTGVVLTWRRFLSFANPPSLVKGLPHHGSPFMFSTCLQHATPLEIQQYALDGLCSGVDLKRTNTVSIHMVRWI
jgi:hypothetical protein